MTPSPRAAMEEAARLLMTRPSTHIPLLAEALRAVKGQAPAAVVVRLIKNEVEK